MSKVSKEWVEQWWSDFAKSIELDERIKKSVGHKIINEVYDFGFSEDQFMGSMNTFVSDTAFDIIKRFS